MALFKKRGKWYIDYYYEGRRIREAIGPSKRAAEMALAARKGEILQGRFNLHQVKPTPLFEAFAEEYLSWTRAQHRSWQSLTASRLPRLLEFFRGRRLGEITPWQVEKYKGLRREQVKPATVNRELAVLSSMLSKAIEWGHLREHPMKGGRVRKLREENRVARILTDEEETRLLKEDPPWLQHLLVLALDTGLRLGELLGLTRDGVDVGRRVVKVVHTKNGRGRTVPLTGRAVAALTAQRRSAAEAVQVFPSGPGQAYWRVRSAFLRACRRAGISGLRFHDLRHTFATRLVTRRVDLATVQKLLGHADVRMTLRYSHPTSADMAQAVQVLEAGAEHRHHMDTTAKMVSAGE